MLMKIKPNGNTKVKTITKLFTKSHNLPKIWINRNSTQKSKTKSHIRQNFFQNNTSNYFKNKQKTPITFYFLVNRGVILEFCFSQANLFNIFAEQLP